MASVEKGASRQEGHEVIRQLSVEAAKAVKERGEANPLQSMIEQHEFFAPIKNDLPKIMDASTLTGRAEQQVEKFAREEVYPALKKYENLGQEASHDLHV